jgi:hypothetical protein
VSAQRRPSRNPRLTPQVPNLEAIYFASGFTAGFTGAAGLVGFAGSGFVAGLAGSSLITGVAGKDS